METKRMHYDYIICSEDQLEKHSRKNNDVGLYDESHSYATLRINE